MFILKLNKFNFKKTIGETICIWIADFELASSGMTIVIGFIIRPARPRLTFARRAELAGARLQTTGAALDDVIHFGC